MTDSENTNYSPVAVGAGNMNARALIDERSLARDLVFLRRDMVENRKVECDTCPMCGTNPAGNAKKQLLFVPSWVWVGLLLNIIVLAILYVVGRRIVKTELPLCADCAKADKRAHGIRSASLLGVILGPLGALFVSQFFTSAVLYPMTIGLVAGIAGIVAAHRKTKHEALICKKIDKETIQLEASGHFGTILANEAPEVLATHLPVG